MIHIAVITGTRAEYGILKPVIDAIDFTPSMKMSLIATGMHLAPEFGMTVCEIENDGIPISARVDMLLNADTTSAMGKSLGIGIVGLIQELERLKPDVVIVLGDRIEAFAGAISGLFCGAVIAHIHGGEITRGGVDEYLRHAITKLSHVHFAATETARQRIIRLGEHPNFVFHTGSPALDVIRRMKILSREELPQKLAFPLPEQYALVVQHPISTHPETAALEIEETLEALRSCQISTILAYPNADAGGRAMRDVIRRYETYPWLHTYINLPRPVYMSLLSHASVMAGNSSSGLIDSSSFGIPTINIGERQEGRERGKNVIDAKPDRDCIREAIHRALTDELFIHDAKNAVNPYGDGYAADKILIVLQSLDLIRVRQLKRLPW